MILESLLSVDSGGCSGFSYWNRGRLQWVNHGNPEERLLLFAPVTDLVIEWPHKGDGNSTKGDLQTLTYRAGLVVGQVIALQGSVPRVERVLANTWKGTSPKDVFAQRFVGALDTYERLIWEAYARTAREEDAHNALDSLGLGLWKLGRLPKGGTLAKRAALPPPHMRPAVAAFPMPVRRRQHG